MSTQARLTLTAAVGARAWRERLAAEQAQPYGFTLSFADVSPIHRAFAPMAREQKFDVSEMAIATYLQAKVYGKPLVLLPLVTAARFQEAALFCLRDSDIKSPADLGPDRPRE